MKRKHKRLTFVVIAGLLVATAIGLALTAFEENIVFFRTPTDIVENKVEEGRRIRLGGLVVEDSVVQGEDGTVVFGVTDTANDIKVSYLGILPDLFREGQGIVAEGKLTDGVFVADEVLAKHDENYMPPEVADALKEAEHWQPEQEGQTQ
jgi:cytochrome c-type biogenesis protein CcmE